MPAKGRSSKRVWRDPDDAPEWTEDQFRRAEFAIGGKVIRPAQGTLTRGPGRPRAEKPKVAVSLRLDPDVLAAFKATGPGWQGRVNIALAEASKGLRKKPARKRA